MPELLPIIIRKCFRYRTRVTQKIFIKVKYSSNLDGKLHFFSLQYCRTLVKPVNVKCRNFQRPFHWWDAQCFIGVRRIRKLHIIFLFGGCFKTLSSFFFWNNRCDDFKNIKEKKTGATLFIISLVVEDK